MNTKDIVCFRALYEIGSLSKTAEQMYLTPQGVSSIIKKMENELGVPLFKRTSTGMISTNYGRILYEKSDDLYESLQSMNDLFRLEEENAHGSLRLASAQGILASINLETIFSFNRRYPNFTISMSEASDCRVEELVLSGQADLGLAVEPVDREKFDVFSWLTMEEIAYVHKDNPLSQKEILHISDLEDQKIIIESEEFKIFHIFRDLCLRNGFEPDIYFSTLEIDFANSLANDNRGIAISVNAEGVLDRYHNLVVKHFAENLDWQWCIIKKKNAYMTEIEHKLVRYLRGVTLEEL